MSEGKIVNFIAECLSKDVTIIIKDNVEHLWKELKRTAKNRDHYLISDLEYYLIYTETEPNCIIIWEAINSDDDDFSIDLDTDDDWQSSDEEYNLDEEYNSDEDGDYSPET